MSAAARRLTSLNLIECTGNRSVKRLLKVQVITLHTRDKTTEIWLMAITHARIIKTR